MVFLGGLWNIPTIMRLGLVLPLILTHKLSVGSLSIPQQELHAFQMVTGIEGDILSLSLLPVLRKEPASFHYNSPVMRVILPHLHDSNLLFILSVPHTAFFSVQPLRMLDPVCCVPRKCLGYFSIMVHCRHILANLQVLQVTLLSHDFVDILIPPHHITP